MKLIIALFLLCSSAFATEYMMSADKILLTSEGIFVNIDSHLVNPHSVTYLGSGIYTVQYYGQCGRCGWALDENGKCSNQNCNQYGPRERD
jgi:hypothetical protein